MTDSALGQLGVDLDNTYASAGVLPFDQGVEVVTRNGKAILALAPVAFDPGGLCVIAPASAAASVSVVAITASASRIYGGRLAIAQTSVAATEYGWFHTEGNKEVEVLVAADAAPANDTKMYLNGVVVDDATASTAILGIQILGTGSAGGNTLVPAVFSNMKPHDAA